MESLWSFFHQLLAVHTPGQGLLDVDAQGAVVRNLLHIVPFDDEWWNVSFFFLLKEITRSLVFDVLRSCCGPWDMV